MANDELSAGFTGKPTEPPTGCPKDSEVSHRRSWLRSERCRGRGRRSPIHCNRIGAHSRRRCLRGRLYYGSIVKRKGPKLLAIEAAQCTNRAPGGALLV